MRPLSDTSRTASFNEDEALAELQLYLWERAKRGWNPMHPNSPHWSFDDNTQSQALGWIIAQSPGTDGGALELIGLDRHQSREQLFETISRMANIDPICAKALRVLTAQKLRGVLKK